MVVRTAEREEQDMVTKPCQRCGADIEFDTVSSHAVGNQPTRRNATCPACGAKHYVMVENPDLYGMYSEDEEGSEPES